MRILMQTNDEATEQSYLCAAREIKEHTICILHGEAQTLERAFREPFDALIIDDRSGTSGRTNVHRTFFPDNLILLFDTFPDSFSTDITYAFYRSTPPKTVLKRVVSFPPARSHGIGTDAAISRFLQRMGVPVHLTGFYLLKESIRLILTLERPTEIRVTRDLYAALAALTRLPPSGVEHAIRHAIGAAWLRADVNLLESVFGYTVSSERAMPSNAAFLFTAAERIRLENKGVESWNTGN